MTTPRVEYPVTYVYVHAVDPSTGASYVYRYVATGNTDEEVAQAVRDATKHLGSHYVRLAEVYTHEPRVFELRPEVIER